MVSCSTEGAQKRWKALKTLDFSHFTNSEKTVKIRGWPHNWPQQNSIVFYVSRRSEGGIAPVSGTGDRGFESRRFDQKDRFWRSFFILSKQTRTRTHLAHFALFSLTLLLIFVRTQFGRELGSHSKWSRGELAHQRRAIGIFTSGENPDISFLCRFNQCECP